MRALLVLACSACSAFSACADGVETHTHGTGLLPETDHGPRVDARQVTLSDGSVVISRPGDEPGETELWHQPSSSRDEGRVLFPAPGADDRPTLLPDGRLLFVSTRTTIASLWVGDLKTGKLLQLTNRGLAAGKPRHGFVPPPHGEIMILDEKTIEYDAGGGVMQRVRIEEVAR